MPVKTDMIDMRIAEYINNYPDRSKMKVMFVRESEGVYKFGSKRVYIRVDKEKINVRVGGGFITIDEFIDQYSNGEVQALERQDPMKVLSDKVEVSCALCKRGRSDKSQEKQRGGRESSPVIPIMEPNRGIRTSFAKNMK